MSDIFFDELNIPKPDYNLGIGSGSHADQTARMMVGIEEVLLVEKPNYILLYGDTNSTLAGAIAASKIHIPIIHIEAGLRSFNMNMPEELNRILTDRISSLLFCPTDISVNNLKNEGIIKGVHLVGDVMCDAVLYYTNQLVGIDKSFYFNQLIGLFGKIDIIDKWYLATIHRAENTDSIKKISEILKAFELFDYPVIFPVHPRTKGLVEVLYSNNKYKNIFFIEPIGYKEMLYFEKNAVKVVTDSGGLQKEAYILGTPCVTVRDQTEWVETLVGNNNILVRPDCDDIINKTMYANVDMTKKKDYYGNGDASVKICEILNKR
jgi:UDP-N-acetylglucosamine 2-epimerase (non-hydrolysing)/UDP-GlcNAc3NAcA epimerase